MARIGVRSSNFTVEHGRPDPAVAAARRSHGIGPCGSPGGGCGAGDGSGLGAGSGAVGPGRAAGAVRVHGVRPRRDVEPHGRAAICLTADGVLGDDGPAGSVGRNGDDVDDEAAALTCAVASACGEPDDARDVDLGGALRHVEPHVGAVAAFPPASGSWATTFADLARGEHLDDVGLQADRASRSRASVSDDADRVRDRHLRRALRDEQLHLRALVVLGAGAGLWWKTVPWAASFGWLTMSALKPSSSTRVTASSRGGRPPTAPLPYRTG